MKKPFVIKLASASAGFSLLVYPLSAVAGPLSFLRDMINATATETSAQVVSFYNSQTLPLLQPAVNIDPKPSRGGGDITVVDGKALLPESGPSGTLADIEERPASSEISVYVVHQGDTLSEIAAMFGVSVNTILWANDIQNGVIHEGQTLVILPVTGVKHTVGKGDTLASIAKKYKTDVGEVAQFNGLADGASLAVGTILVVPNVELATPAPVVKKPSVKTTTPLRGTSSNQFSGAFIWPVEGGAKTQGLHGYNGIDIGAPNGTPIYAAAGGTVIIAREGGWNGGYGSYVVITHDDGVQTLYGHMSRVAAGPGERVSQGQVIGYVGSTGRSTGSHLHFEVRGAVNPF